MGFGPGLSDEDNIRIFMFRSVWKLNCFSDGTLRAFDDALSCSCTDVEISEKETEKWMKEHGKNFQIKGMPFGAYIGLVPRTKINRDVDWDYGEAKDRD